MRAHGLTLVQVLYYIIQESQEIYHSGAKLYFRSFWNSMDIVNLVLFLSIFYLRITTTFEIQTTVLENVSGLRSAQLQNIAFQVDLEKNLIGINCVLLWAKFLKYVSAHKTFSRITRTIGLASSEILIFFLIFGLSMFGFAMGGVSWCYLNPSPLCCVFLRAKPRPYVSSHQLFHLELPHACIAQVLILGVDNEEYRSGTSIESLCPRWPCPDHFDFARVQNLVCTK